MLKKIITQFCSYLLTNNPVFTTTLDTLRLVNNTLGPIIIEWGELRTPYFRNEPFENEGCCKTNSEEVCDK